MVSHYDVHHVFRSSLLHMAANAFRGRRMASRRRCVTDRGPVALLAHIGVMPDTLAAALRSVRIVTRRARHGAITLQKAERLAEPVRGTIDDLEFVVMAASGRMIEYQQKARKRLARLE